MDGELNVTHLTFGGFVDLHKYRYVYFMVMFTIYILIMCGNITIVSLICKHETLHEPMYIFIAALLLNSALYSTVIYPKLFIDFLSEKQIISYSACFFQLFLYYTSWGSEFFLLSAMAYDRYVSICKPLQYLTIMRKTTVSVLLVLAWFLPACQISLALVLNSNSKLCSFTIDGIFCDNSVYSVYCVRSSALAVYGMICLVSGGILPVFFILFTYIRILLVCYRSSTEVRTKAAQTCLPHLLVLINFTCLCSYGVIIARIETNFSKTVRLIMSLQSFLYHPLFNPIIYGVKMTEISKHLKGLFCEHKPIMC
ncbi:putative olfactory receptor 4A4 [Antennarius striatus]|uniref:putative olfactory receptor 4A4 n=1 Tax=Antennarius striatus TaxID=241820 RepID=UPI0035B20BEC